MAYESDIRSAQHITTSNNYLNYIHILSPTESARRVFNAGNITTSNNYLNYIHILSPIESARRVFSAKNRL